MMCKITNITLFGVYSFKYAYIQHKDIKIVYPTRCDVFHVFQ